MEAWLLPHLLTIVVFLPLGAALFLLASGFLSTLAFGSRGLPGVLWRAIAVSASSLTFIGALWVLAEFDPERTGYQLVERLPWLPDQGVSYFVGIDGISLVLVLLTAFVVPVVLVSSWREIAHSERSFVVLVLFLETGLLGAFVSLNLLQFYLFWEVVLVPVYFILGVWGGDRRREASLKFFLYSLVGSALMLVAILVLNRLHIEQSGVPNLDLVTLPGEAGMALLDTHIAVGSEVPWWQRQGWLFAAFALAFGVKLPVVPLHSWLPDAHVQAPTAGTVLMAAVLVKLGAYGLLRFALPLFPDVVASQTVVGWAFGLALAGVLYASLIAMVQTDVKRLVAYACIAQVGLALLGIFALNVHGLTGAVIQLVAHGLSAAALFVLVGFLYERRETHALDAFGGVAKPMPVFAALLAVAVLSQLGLPALAGFVGEFLILLGAFQVAPWVAVGAGLHALLAAGYLFWTFRRIALGPVEPPENRGLIDLDWRERMAVIALLVPVIWVGLYPNPLIRRVEPSVMELLRVMDERAGPRTGETEDEALVTRRPPVGGEG